MPLRHAPLAERIRPKRLADIVGQEHLTGKNGLLARLTAEKKLVSMIFWGPPGSGKTTLARILALKSGASFHEISAVRMGMPEVKKILARAENELEGGMPTVSFVDEIHRFNKAQQDTFLPFVERGIITLIGATTENPSFEVISPLLSRCRVVVLKALGKKAIEQLIDRAMKTLPGKSLSAQARNLLVLLSGGDARVALNGLEVAADLSGRSITQEAIETALQQPALTDDKKADSHYDWVSAFIKSMRGSDADAALFYLHRMLEAGEDPKFIARRIVIFAAEDIGLASPHALTLAVSVFEAVERIGLPEGKLILSEAAIAMAKAPKSRTVADAMGKAIHTVLGHPDATVPLHLRNAPTKLMNDLGYQKGYQWEANFQHKKGFWPKNVKRTQLYRGEKDTMQ